MFVASSLFNYATGSSSSTQASSEALNSKNSRVKRHPTRKHGASGEKSGIPTSPPPSYASVAAGITSAEGGDSNSIEVQLANDEASRQRTAAELAKMSVIDTIVKQEDLYDVLGVKRNAKTEDIRRGFLNRSRVCHPDKFPSYAPCVVAFQKVSFAYQTLSKPSSRRLYDVSGRVDLAAALNDTNGTNGPPQSGFDGDETLNGVLYSVFCEVFLDGDFEMIRVLVNALNESNPGLNLGDDAVDNIEGAFAKLREIVLAGKKYLTIVRFELIRLYEIQHSLRQLSYFDVFGRLRLTLQLARVALSIPMAIDQAMKESDGSQPSSGESEGHDSLDGISADIKLREGLPKSDGDDDDGFSSDDSASDTQHHRRVQDDFGMRPDDDDDDDDIHGFDREPARREEERPKRRKKQRASKRARVEAARKARIQEQEAKALRRKGLLGSTTAGLLKGVVKVLETSEAWVPGQAKRGGNDD